MKTINIDELKKILLKQKGTTFVSLETETLVKVKGGKKCPFYGLIKRSKINGGIGVNYENSVNLQKNREGQIADFRSEQRTWGKRIKGTPIVEHNGKTYLELKVEKTDTPDYFFKGQRVDNEIIYTLLPKRAPSRQDLDNEIILRDYALSSIKRIKMNGKEFAIL